MKKYFNKEVIIGFLTLLSLGMLYFGLNYLKGANIFKPTNIYYVRMPDVSELQNACPVYVNGFKVGIVSGINYDYRSWGNIIVQISLDKKMRVETGSYVEIKSGLTSGAYLNLILNKYVSAFCQVGDTIDGVSRKGMMETISQDLLPQIEIILPRLDSILMGIQLLVNHPALLQTFDHLEASTANIEKTTNRLNGLLLNDIQPILSNLNKVSSDFTIVSDQLKQMDLNKTLNRVDNTIANLEALTNNFKSKDNSLGLLLNDRGIYDRLDSTFVNASDLLLDLRLNPKRYVHFSIFGKK